MQRNDQICTKGISLPNEPQDLDKQQKSVIIPSEEEIMQISSGTQTINNQTQANFTYQQSLTMI